MPGKAEMSDPYDHVGVIGAGAWGTALALVAAGAGRRVTLWARHPDPLAQVRENVRHLPGSRFPESLRVTGALAEAAGAEALLVAVPAQALRATLERLAPHRLAVPVVLCAKGLERQTGKLLTEVLAEVAPGARPAILSGPSFAGDVARGRPTAVTIAAAPEIAARLQASLQLATFRPYASEDLTGVALGGAAKNVYAIASGVVEGLGLGESACAALIARSFAELARIGEALGARRETLMGLSGLGDLVLSATSPASRNFAFGRALGEGEPPERLNEPDRPLAEGAASAPALVARARAHRIELPIAETVADLLAGSLPLGGVVARLMRRPLTSE